MKKLAITAGLAVAAGLGMAAPVQAHHSAAMFDHSHTVVLKGFVKEFDYTNPHSWLLVMVTGADGQSAVWSFEAEGPSTLLRAGIKAKTFVPGDSVTVTAFPMKDGRTAGSMVSVTKADGSVYSPRPSGPINGAS